MKNNRLDLYKRTTDILFKAYFNDTLEHGNCYACAVGNIAAANNGYEFVEDKKALPPNFLFSQRLYWKGFTPYSHRGEHLGHTNGIQKTATYYVDTCETIPPTVKEQIEKTGYTITELATIEWAFENGNPYEDDLDENMFNGLVATLDALKNIHEIDDNSEEVKRFSEEHQRKLEIA